jgi:hypothetical protein
MSEPKRQLERTTPDLASPLNSLGEFGNASGVFNLRRSLRRKIRSRRDLSQPRRENFGEQTPLSTGTGEDSNAVDRYFGSFSIESKRHVWDLLNKHPKFGDQGKVRLNRIQNNTTEVLPNDPFRNVINGGFISYEKI